MMPIMEETYEPFSNEQKIGESVEDLYMNNLRDDMKLMKAISAESSQPENKWTYDTRDTRKDSQSKDLKDSKDSKDSKPKEEENTLAEEEEKAEEEEVEDTTHVLVKRSTPTYLGYKHENFYLQPLVETNDFIVPEHGSILDLKSKSMRKESASPIDDDDQLYYHLNGEVYKLVKFAISSFFSYPI